MNDEQETNHAFARSRSNAGLGILELPKMDGVEVSPGIFLIGEPTPEPGSNKLRCLAQIGCALCLVELSLNFKMPNVKLSRCALLRSRP